MAGEPERPVFAFNTVEEALAAKKAEKEALARDREELARLRECHELADCRFADYLEWRDRNDQPCFECGMFNCKADCEVRLASDRHYERVREQDRRDRHETEMQAQARVSMEVPSA